MALNPERERKENISWSYSAGQAIFDMDNFTAWSFFQVAEGFVWVDAVVVLWERLPVYSGFRLLRTNSTISGRTVSFGRM